MMCSPLAANDATNERTRSDLEDKFRHARPEVLEVLRELLFYLREAYH